MPGNGYNIEIPDIVINGIPRPAGNKLPPTTANSLSTAGSKILDTLLGIGSAFAAVELDNRSLRNAYANSGNGAGYYKGADGQFHPIPTDDHGRPLPGYSGAGMVNDNVLIIGALVVAGVILFNRG